MRILLEKCAFLWMVSGDSRLDAKVATAIRDRSNEVFRSQAHDIQVCAGQPQPVGRVAGVSLARQAALLP